MSCWLLVVLAVFGFSWSWPICPNRSSTAGQPRFTKKLGEFDYVEFGKQIAIQCCSEGTDDIRWYRQENGQWKSFPIIQPGISNAPRLEEDKQVLRIFDAEFKDNTTFKCELGSSLSGQSGQNGFVQKHQLQLFVVACDKRAGGPILTQPFPKDQYIEDFGGNLTIPCTGYFGCSDYGKIEGDALWLVKQNGRFDLAVNVSPRYRASNYSNPDKTMEMVNLTISPVMPDDLDRTFICKVTSPQVPSPHMSQTVRIIKKQGPVDVVKLVGIAVGAVLVLVLVIFLLKALIGKLWGPQIKWFFRSRVSFVGPKPAEDENLAYNAFLYHDDQDTRIANELKEKLEQQNFLVYLSSDAPANKPKMACIQEESSKSAVVIFLYTENLWSDAFNQFLFQCVVEDRKGKGILFLEIEKFAPEKAVDETKKAREKYGRKDVNHTDLSISVEQDGAHANHDDEIQKVPDEKEGKIDVKFWRALPRLKVPAKESTHRQQKNFQCAIQNRLPLLKSQILAQKQSAPFSAQRSDGNRHSSSGKPLLAAESQGLAPSPGFSPMSDEVFVSDVERTKFAFDNEATNISRNGSVQHSQQDAIQGYPQNQAAAYDWQPFILPQFQNEAGASQPMTVSADIHHSNEVPSIFPKKSGIPKTVQDIHEINETKNDFLHVDPIKVEDSLTLDSINADQNCLSSENDVFMLSGDEGGNLPDDQSERFESGFTEESLNPNQSESQIKNTHSISPVNSNDMNIEPSAFEKKNNQNGLQNQNSDDSEQLDIRPGAPNSFGSGHESGYVTSPTTGSLGSSPEGLMVDPFKKLNARNTDVKNSISA